MTKIISARKSTEAYVHVGVWIADCGRTDCYNAMAVDAKQSSFYCADCYWIGELIWPADAEQIFDVLEKRPVPGTRHWAPAGHRQAIACGFPEGQSVNDLIAENEENL